MQRHADSGEIQTLVESGYWIGGAARWRALHETAATAKLIATSDAAIARRDLDHGFVVQTRRLKAYYDQHGVGPLKQSELDLRVAEVEKANTPSDSNYHFRDSYGWAMPLMPRTRKGGRVSPTLDALEKLANLDHRRLLVASSHGRGSRGRSRGCRGRAA